MFAASSAHPEEKAAELAVLNAVVNAAALHLERSREESSGQPEPVLIQVGGPGRTAFLDLLELRLDPACVATGSRAGRQGAAPSEHQGARARSDCRPAQP